MPIFDAHTLPDRSRTLLKFVLPLAILLGLYAIDLICMAGLPTSPAWGSAYATNAALPFDLVVVVPTAFYFLVVRRRGLSPLFVLPVMWVGMVVSLQFVQAGMPSLHLLLLPAVALVDLVVFVREGRRFAGVFRSAKNASANPHDWFSEAFCALTQNAQASHVMANEMAVWYYVLASWRRTPDVPEGSRAFTCHRKSGYVALVGVIVALTGVETFAVHLLVAQWSEVAAVLLSAASVYAALFLAGNARAVVLNPLLVDDEALAVRWGMFVDERIPLDDIAHIQSSEPDVPKRERLNLGVMGMEPCWIVLREPASIRTFGGSRRPVRAVNVSPDEAATFKQLVLQGRAERPSA
ncbi:MAG: hypothetical protein RR178_10765 [Gordonibacter sp.]